MSRLVLCHLGARSAVGAARVSALVAAVAADAGCPVVEAPFDAGAGPGGGSPSSSPGLVDLLRPADVVVPLEVSPGRDVDREIVAVAARVGAHVAPVLGPAPQLTSILADRLADRDPDDRVVLGAAGSRGRAGDLAVRLAGRELTEVSGRAVYVGYLDAAAPRLPGLVHSLRELGPGQPVVVASYLLAPGPDQDRLEELDADAVTAPLLDDARPDPRLVSLVLGRAGVARGATLRFLSRRSRRTPARPRGWRVRSGSAGP